MPKLLFTVVRAAQRALRNRLIDHYEPALHYMRGVGPKSQQRAAPIKHES